MSGNLFWLPTRGRGSEAFKASGWPLAGIPFAAALQATDLKPGVPQTTISVVGAGTTSVNGSDVFAGLGSWISPNGSYFQWDTDRWKLYSSDNTLQYLQFGPSLETSLPSDNPVYVTGGGSLPLPTISAVSSPFARTLGLFQDAGQTVPCVNWGDLEYIFADKLSTSGAVASQSVSTQRPALQYAPNGAGLWLPSNSFDGVDNRMDLTVPIPGDFSVFFSFRAINGDIGLAGSLAAFRQFRVGEVSNCLSAYAGTAGENPISSPLPIDESEWSTVGFIRSGSTIEFFQNNVSLGTGTLNGAMDIDTIGELGAGGENYINGNIAACLISLTAVSSSDRAKIFTYLATLLPA